MSSQIYQEVPGTSSRVARIRYPPPPDWWGPVGPLSLVGLGRPPCYCVARYAKAPGNAPLRFSSS
jgi:hypothetical protein